MPDYLVHSSRERARLRHTIFSDDATKAAAMESLKNEEGIAGIKPGASSILLFLEPDADINRICANLEENFPLLRETDAAMPQTANAAAIARKHSVEWLLTAGVTTVGLILFGLKHAHAWAGGVFTVLAAHHVWVRRNRL